MGSAVLVQVIGDAEGDIVLLPPGFEFDAEEVEIDRRGDTIRLRPLPRLLANATAAS